MHTKAQKIVRMPSGARRVGVAVATVLAAVGVGVGIVSTVASAAARPHTNGVPIVVYSAQGYDKAMVAAFEKASGYTVELDDNSTGPLLTQIEASKNNPKWGLLWVDGATAFAELDDQGLLVRGFEPPVSWNKLGTADIPTDKSYIPTGVTLMAAMVYKPKDSKNPPTTWHSLLSTAYQNEVGMNDPSQSGPTYPFIAGMMQYLGSVGAGRSYFSDLKKNGLVINPTNGPTLQALASGEIKYALVQSSAGIGAVLGDHNLSVKYLSPVTLLPSCIGIDSKVSKQEQIEAEAFVKYVLSAAGQKVMQSGDPTGDSLYYPVLNGVKPLKALPSLAGVKTQTINPYKWGPLEPSINTWFDDTIVK
ncbi:MAG: extracellular solute-binding protein [Acidimicrobiales bacterium]